MNPPSLKRQTFILCSSLALLLGACNLTPSPRDGRNVFDHRYNPANAKVTDFAKTDGQESNTFGIRRYRMSFVATLECTASEGCCLRSDAGPLGMYKPACVQQVTAGGKFTVSGAILFEKSEKGWTDKQFEIDSIKPYDLTGTITGGWNFVIAAYSLTAVVFILYGVTLAARLRKARATSANSEDGA